jgi:WD40 repeat protein
MKRLLSPSLFLLALVAVGVAGCTAGQERPHEVRAYQAAAQSSSVPQNHLQFLVPKAFLPGQQVGASRSAAVEEAISLTGHQGPVRDVIFSPDGRWLVTVSDDNTARLWDVATLLPSPARMGNTGLTASDSAATALVLGGHGDWISAAAFSPDTLTGTGSRWLVTASWDGTARLWDLSTPDPAGGAPFVLRGHQGPIGAVAFSPDAPRGLCPVHGGGA